MSGKSLNAHVASLLDRFERGELGREALERELAKPYVDLGFAKFDVSRENRRGIPEVIYCAGKTPEQVKALVLTQRELGGIVLCTKAGTNHAEALSDIAGVEHYPRAGIIRLRNSISEQVGSVLVVSAGTSDQAIAEEAALTAETFGSRVSTERDVGVAGLGRILSIRNQLESAAAIVVVAGMDGALPSVVSGLTSKPIVAVPTSVGYGASFSGIAPLLTMLNSCSPGVAVVNIDNGFGAGYYAHVINSEVSKRDE